MAGGSESALKKKSIIIDANSYSVESLHAALAFAELSNQTSNADVKIIFPRMLFAEITVSNHSFSQIQKYRIDHGKLTKPKREDRVRLHQLLDAYSDYIEFPPLSATEKRIKGAMMECLSDFLETHGDEYVYNFVDSSHWPLVKNALDLDTLLDNPILFADVYDSCLKYDAFHNSLQKLGLTSDLADHAIVEWYASIPRNTRPAVLLVSTDHGLTIRMNEEHDRPDTTNTPAAPAQFHNFDQLAFADYLLAEMRTFTTEGTSQAINLMACTELCDTIKKTKKPMSPDRKPARL